MRSLFRMVAVHHSPILGMHASPTTLAESNLYHNQQHHLRATHRLHTHMSIATDPHPCFFYGSLMERRVLDTVTRPGPEANLHTVRASIEVKLTTCPPGSPECGLTCILQLAAVRVTSAIRTMASPTQASLLRPKRLAWWRASWFLDTL